MEGEALASRILELGPVGAKFLGYVVATVTDFIDYVSCFEFWGFCSIVAVVGSVKQGYNTALVGNQTPTLESEFLYVHAVCVNILCMYACI